MVDTVLKNIVPDAAKTILGYDVWDFKKPAVILICLIFYIVYIGTGITVGVTQYDSIVTQKFISMDINSGDCLEVPRSLNANYEADDLGQWSTSSRFQYKRALYTASASL